MRGLDALAALVEPRDPLDELRTVAKSLLAPTTPAPTPLDDDPSESAAPDAGWIEHVRIRELRTDPSYQRPPDREKVRAIADGGKKLKRILVNCRSDGWGYYVLDGQHRALAALARGDETIEARVLMVPQEREPYYCQVTTHDGGGTP